ncbi:MAG: hypothetical protein GF383_04615 [Candidatus Lokiarchaeota archaeon]|nr:hypothetical protein [Candidatus Lokiarchaeota archaeon]MBD3339068.1 hypothetical protein [Candidatus Lokiarchaeota archaeon]
MSMDKKLSKTIDYESIFDIELSIEEYSEKLEDLLKHSRIGIVEQRKILRQKVQEFKDKKKRHLADVRKRK